MNIFGQKPQLDNQPRTNMFDRLHSSKPSESIFNKMSPPNNKEEKIENKNIFQMSKMPAANIFSVNANVTTNPSMNVVTPNINIFAMGSKTS